MPHPRANGFPVSLDALRGEADRIEALLDQADAAFERSKGQALTERWSAAMDRRRAACRAIATSVEANGGSIRDANAGHVRVRHMGLTSSCTAGTGGALRNWINAARRRLEQLERTR